MRGDANPACGIGNFFGKVSSSGSKFGEERPRFALPCFEHTARDLAVRSASLPDSHPHTRQPPPHPASEIIPSRLYRLCGFSKISSKFLRNLGALSAQLVKEIWVPGERNSGPSQFQLGSSRCEANQIRVNLGSGQIGSVEEISRKFLLSLQEAQVYPSQVNIFRKFREIWVPWPRN